MAGKLSERSLFLHFVNREVHFLKRSSLDEADHMRLIKEAGMMTSGCLVAPFAQVSELYYKKHQINKLIAALCSALKLCLYNGAGDYLAFMENRRELYGDRKDRYPVYFQKDGANKSTFQTSNSLDTTRYIKSTLVSAVTPGMQVPNIISTEEAFRLATHRSFISSDFAAGSQAATFSIYENQAINPKPAEVSFFGHVSCRLFIYHYAERHDLIVPTGVYNDPHLETFERFPYFDLVLQRVLIDKLEIRSIVSDDEFHDPYISIIQDTAFPFFCAMREVLFRVLSHIAGSDPLNPAKSRLAILPLLHSLDFSAKRTIGPTTAFGLGLAIEEALRKACLNDGRFAAAKEALQIMTATSPIVLLLTATPLEDQVFRAQAALTGFRPTMPQTFREFTGTLYKKGNGAELWHVRTSAGSAGIGGSARIADLAIRELKPSFVFAVGIAFGLYDSKQSVADVMVAETICPYERGRQEEGRFKRRGEILACAPETVSFASQYELIDTSFAVHVGPMMSGEKLVDDQNFTRFLRTVDEKAIGGEMEAAGIVQACQVLSVRFSLIKGIADFGHNKGDKDQQKAAQNAFRFFFEVFQRFDGSGTFIRER